MDLKNCIVTAANEIASAILETQKQLASTDSQAMVEFPHEFEVEFGLNPTFEIANYDDVQIAKVRVVIPWHTKGTTEFKAAVSPLLEEETQDREREQSVLDHLDESQAGAPKRKRGRPARMKPGFKTETT